MLLPVWAQNEHLVLLWEKHWQTKREGKGEHLLLRDICYKSWNCTAARFDLIGSFKCLTDSVRIISLALILTVLFVCWSQDVMTIDNTLYSRCVWLVNTVYINTNESWWQVRFGYFCSYILYSVFKKLEYKSKNDKPVKSSKNLSLSFSSMI